MFYHGKKKKNVDYLMHYLEKCCHVDTKFGNNETCVRLWLWFYAMYDQEFNFGYNFVYKKLK